MSTHDRLGLAKGGFIDHGNGVVEPVQVKAVELIMRPVALRLRNVMAICTALLLTVPGCSSVGSRGSDAGVDSGTPASTISTLDNESFSDLRSSWLESAWRTCLATGGYATSPASVQVRRGPDSGGTGDAVLTLEGTGKGPSSVSLDWVASQGTYILAVTSTPDDRFNALLDIWHCPQ